MTQLTPFHFESHEVRTLVHDDGSVWWVLADVCAVLGLSNPSEALRRLESNEYNTLSFSEGIPGNPTRTIVNESGLYRLIFRSNKPEAKKFQSWVFGEVLPQIRKTGAYIVPAASPAPALPSPESQIALYTSAINLLDRLGQLTPRDELMYADAIRNATVSGPRQIATPMAHGFSVAERCTHLGYQLTRKQQAAFLPILGKMLAREYRSRHGEEPRKETRFIDGANRPVSWYPEDTGDWVDAIIQGYLAGFPGLVQERA